MTETRPIWSPCFKLPNVCFFSELKPNLSHFIPLKIPTSDKVNL